MLNKFTKVTHLGSKGVEFDPGKADSTAHSSPFILCCYSRVSFCEHKKEMHTLETLA